MSTPKSPGNQTILRAVSARTPDDVWAVGKYQVGVVKSPLALHWDGVRWLRVGIPALGPEGGELTSVQVFAPDDVWTVGISYQRNTSDSNAVAAHWNGSDWSVMLLPVPANAAPCWANSVSGTSSDDVWTVGSCLRYQSVQGVAQHWDGKTWSVVDTHAAAHTGYTGVTALAADDAWLVGHAGDDNLLSEHWNGSKWKLVDVPRPRDSFAPALTAVDATSPTDVWAVGDYLSRQGQTTLIVHWDGSGWTRSPSPDPELDNALDAISADTSSNAWAVGHVKRNNGARSLRWNGTRWR